MLGPALVGSPRLRAHRDYVVKVLLNGLSGPLDGRQYPDLMAPLGVTSTDEWVAGVASYVRTTFGNNAGMVSAADVARVRRDTAGRKTPWTIAELEASLPRTLDSQQWKLTASHATDTAAGAATLRGWSSGAPQTAGMWFTIELPQPAMVTELQFESAFTGGGRGGGRGAAGAPGAPGAAPPAPVVGYPRGYTVEVSADGKTWSKPVAQGKGEGQRTTITFAPARAKFVRMTQTDTVADGPAWSIRNLRIYEASTTAAKK
jgi:hypothetical protein